MKAKHSILVVEDSDEDFYTTKRVLAKFGTFPLGRCSQGFEVVEYLHQQALRNEEERTDLILLDLNLRGKKDGRDVLVDLKKDRELRKIPVVVLTTSSSPADIDHCYQHGASGYLVKPVDLDAFVQSIECMVKYWFETVILPDCEA